MFNLKYHIASLVAVFLALGIGILIGSAMLGNDALVEYQKQVTNRLEFQLESLRQKNESIEASASAMEMNLNTQREFNRKVLPVLIGGRLNNKNLAIIETNDYRYSGNLIDVLEISGANITSVTSFKNFSDSHINKLKEFEDFQDQNNNIGLPNLVIQETGKAIVSGDMSKANLLLQSDIIQISGTYGGPLDGIIIVGGSNDEQATNMEVIDLELIEIFLANNIPIYAVEETHTVYSYMDFYQKRRVTATVDNIDTVPGQLALVYAINGQPGHYGVKSTAQQLIPDIIS